MGCRTEEDPVKAGEVPCGGLESWLLRMQAGKELAIDGPGDEGDTPLREE